jgi:hypothetical protein
MTPLQPTRRSGPLLALACCLALLAPAGAATRPSPAAAAAAAALAGAPDGAGQDLLRDPPTGPLLGSGRRDERHWPATSLPALSAAALVLAAARVAGRRAGRPVQGRGPAAAAARAPPPLQPASI